MAINFVIVKFCNLSCYNFYACVQLDIGLNIKQTENYF